MISSIDVSKSMTMKLDSELPKMPEFVAGIRRAPDRGFALTKSQAVVEDICFRVKSGQSQRKVAGDLRMKRDTVRGIITNPIYGGRIALARRNCAGHGALLSWQQMETYTAPFLHEKDAVLTWEEWCALQDAEKIMAHSGERSGELL